MNENGAEQRTVDVGPCRCSGGADDPSPLHPDGDSVTLREKADLQMGLAADAALYQAAQSGIPGAGYAALAWTYLCYGIESWSFVEDGKPVPITAANIQEWVSFDRGGRELAEAAHLRFGETVTVPLRAPRNRWRLPTPRDDSTSPSQSSGPLRPISSLPRSRSRRAVGT